VSIEISIQRYDPTTDAEPRWVDYRLPERERMSVLECLMYVYESIDSTLAFRFGCRFNKCGLCAVEVDGRPRIACFTDIRNGMKIAPLAGMPIVRDLVIDRAAFFEALRELELFIPGREDAEAPQVLQQSDLQKKLLGCVECLACNATCPEYDFESNPLAGPYVFAKLAQLHLDPRNVIDRRRQARELGLDRCTECGRCRCFHGINIERDVFGSLSED
jgi:succinate dehydrogenase/fumarate reductase iron-sulfur protein